jgi:ATP-dependent DNA helicase RecG
MQRSLIYKEPYTVDAIVEYCMEPRTKVELYNHFFDMSKKDYGYFIYKYIDPLIEKGILEYTIPDKPKSKYQKIKTSEQAVEMLYEH